MDLAAILAKVAAHDPLTFAEWVTLHDTIHADRGEEWAPDLEPEA